MRARRLQNGRIRMRAVIAVEVKAEKSRHRPLAGQPQQQIQRMGTVANEDAQLPAFGTARQHRSFERLDVQRQSLHGRLTVDLLREEREQLRAPLLSPHGSIAHRAAIRQL